MVCLISSFSGTMSEFRTDSKPLCVSLKDGFGCTRLLLKIFRHQPFLKSLDENQTTVNERFPMEARQPLMKVNGIHFPKGC